MSEETVSEVGKYILPFSVLSERRSKPFTPEMEIAAVFSVSELNRSKGGRILLKRSKENITFIAKIGYPLWLFSICNKVLLFDGLGISDYNLQYGMISNVKPLAEILKTGSKTLETHIALLTDHTNYFSAAVKEKNLLIKGLISDPDFLKEMDSYRREATEIENQPINIGLISPTIQESKLLSITHELADLRSTFEKDIKTLNVCMKLLSKATQTFLKELNDRTIAIREEFAAKINEEEEIVAPKVNALREEYDKKTIELAKEFESKRLPLHTQKMKLEKSKEEITSSIDQYQLEAKTRADLDDQPGKQRGKRRANVAKQQLSGIQDQLEKNEEDFKDLENQRTSEATELRSTLEAGIKEARKNLVEIETLRDAKILTNQQEMEKLQQKTKLLCDQICSTTMVREKDISQFEKLWLKQESENLSKALVYVPFYVVCYDYGKAKKRYLVIPPSSVGSIDISTKLKGALGRAKIKAFLVPRFKAITSLTDVIQSESQRNSIFKTELREIGEENNILAQSSALEEIEKGLLSLRDQGWLTDKDYGTIAANAKISLGTHH
ncbi:MAG: hypothetical protein ABSE15_01055 [Candidatus Bathyarchaeia archaeon]